MFQRIFEPKHRKIHEHPPNKWIEMARVYKLKSSRRPMGIPRKSDGNPRILWGRSPPHDLGKLQIIMSQSSQLTFINHKSSLHHLSPVIYHVSIIINLAFTTVSTMISPPAARAFWPHPDSSGCLPDLALLNSSWAGFPC